MKLRNWFLLCLAAIVLIVSSSDLFAQRGRSGGSFRSSSGSSRSSSSYSKPSSSSSSKSSWSNSRPSSSSKPASTSKTSVDNSAYKAAKSSGKAFTTKESAMADFKAKSATKYTSKYDKEPSARPSHIPASTNVDGRSVNVTYNQQYGGYGYMHPSLGTWMMYDMMSDAVMMSAMMSRDGYYVGSPTVVHSGGGSVFPFIVLAIIVIVLVILVCGLSKSSSGSWD